jgi:MerR family transcriptional regulator, thiopeptide resistance regulator
MEPQLMKVGELAERSGVSVPTLHHYDEIGLLRPSGRSAAGHRLYSEDDVARLLLIRSLQQTGFSLDEVRGCLDDRGFPLARVLAMHVTRLREQLDRTQRLCRRLEHVLGRLKAGEGVSVGDFLRTIEEMSMIEKYYTPEQLARLATRGELLGADHIREVEAEWPKLMAAVREEMAQGTAPSDPKVQALARRWNALVEEFTGGDAGITQSLARMYQGERQMRERIGLDPGVMDYVTKALGGARDGFGGRSIADARRW